MAATAFVRARIDETLKDEAAAVLAAHVPEVAQMVFMDTAALTAFCERLKSVDFVTVDTEFMRETTYWAKLCLVQVAGPDEAYCIDPLAPGIDLAPLYALLDDAKVLKVFHAGRQDMEIFCKAMGKVPHPVFDTQVAAMVAIPCTATGANSIAFCFLAG